MTLERWKKSDENVNQHMLIRETRDSGSDQVVEHLSNKHQTQSLNPSTTKKKTQVVVFISCKQYFKTRKFFLPQKLKDYRMYCRRSQKVKSDQGETSPSQETSACASETSLPPGNAKKAIKPNPQPDPWDHQFPDPPAFSNMQSFSSLLYK
jgi:hypothetical protein